MKIYDTQRVQSSPEAQIKQESPDQEIRALALPARTMERATERNAIQLKRAQDARPKVVCQSETQQILVSEKRDLEGRVDVTISRPGSGIAQREVLTAELGSSQLRAVYERFKLEASPSAQANPAQFAIGLESALRSAGVIFRNKLRDGGPSASGPPRTEPTVFTGPLALREGGHLTVDAMVAPRSSILSTEQYPLARGVLAIQVIVKDSLGEVVWSDRADAGRLSPLLRELRGIEDSRNAPEGALRSLLVRMGFPFEQLGVARRGAQYFDRQELGDEAVVLSESDVVGDET